MFGSSDRDKARSIIAGLLLNRVPETFAVSGPEAVRRVEKNHTRIRYPRLSKSEYNVI